MHTALSLVEARSPLASFSLTLFISARAISIAVGIGPLPSESLCLVCFTTYVPYRLRTSYVLPVSTSHLFPLPHRIARRYRSTHCTRCRVVNSPRALILGCARDVSRVGNSSAYFLDLPTKFSAKFALCLCSVLTDLCTAFFIVFIRDLLSYLVMEHLVLLPPLTFYCQRI